jgi:Carboxypeptidase regulatory-like domain
MARLHLRAVRRFGLLPVFTAWILAGTIQALAQGQGATATLTGQVVDQSGAAIPKVQLTLTSTAGGQSLTTDTNEAGYYRFSFVRPDTYTLTAAVKGFGDVRIPNITLQVNQTSNVDVTMKPGTVLQQVTVSAAAVALETQSSSLGSVIGEQVNQQLPLILRDPTELVNLVPGVTSDHRMTTAADSSGLSRTAGFRD